MGDRELLELAAKAAGIVIDKSQTNGGGIHNTGFDLSGNAILDWHTGIQWNPLTDDGDALRLVVTLGIDLAVSLAARTTYASKFGHYDDVIEEHDEHGAEAATRRAIVRAAAAIGKEMK